VQTAVDEDVMARIRSRALGTGVHLALGTDDASGLVRTAPDWLLASRAMGPADIGLLANINGCCSATADPRDNGWDRVETGWFTERCEIEGAREDPRFLFCIPRSSAFAKAVLVLERVACDQDLIRDNRGGKTVTEKLGHLGSHLGRFRCYLSPPIQTVLIVRQFFQD
jgi:hypothetical protein